MTTKICSLEGCEEPHCAKGWCKKHYYQARSGKEPSLSRAEYSAETGTCAAPDCSNTFQRRTIGSERLYCSRKCRDRVVKREERAAGKLPPHKRPDSPRCSVEGCEKPRYVHGMCVMHSERVRKYGDPHFSKYDRRPGEWRHSREGYLYRFLDGEKQLQHRFVMSQMLGRPLERFENVHHRNGVRDDNRPENLELWTKPQLAGQRAEDVVKWVTDFYPEILNQLGWSKP